MSFLLKKFLSVLLLPPVLPLLFVAAGLLLWCRAPRLGRWLAWGGLLLALFFTTPATVALLTVPLEDAPVLSGETMQQAQAIVILGAGIRRMAPEYGGPVPNRLALERLRYGARLARASGLPVLLSGGAPIGKVPEAELMAASLAVDFGVTPRWIENTSLDTQDNAAFSARILREAGCQRIVLVTHALHMRRSVREFAAQGLTVFAAPTGFSHDLHSEKDLFYFLPGATSAYDGWYAAHEWLGLLAQRLRGG